MEMKKQLPTYLAQTIKALRVLFNISQKYLAYKLGVKQSVVSDIERGVIKPCQHKIEIIADVMGISVNDIYLLAQGTPEENIQFLLTHLRKTNAKATRQDKKLFVSYFKEDKNIFKQRAESTPLQLES